MLISKLLLSIASGFLPIISDAHTASLRIASLRNLDSGQHLLAENRIGVASILREVATDEENTAKETAFAVKPIAAKTRAKYPALLLFAACISVATVLLVVLAKWFAWEAAGFAYFLVILAAANWSGMNIVFHMASRLGLTFSEAFFWRSVGNVAIPGVLILCQRGNFLPAKNHFWLFVRCLFGCGSTLGLYIAIAQIPLVDAVALYALIPFFAVVLAYFWQGLVPNRWLTGLVLISILGAMLIIQPVSLFSLGGRRLWGSVAAVGAAGSSAAASVLVNMFAQDLPAQMQALWFGVLGLFIAPSIMLLEGKLPHEALISSLTRSDDAWFMLVSIIIIGVSSSLFQLAYNLALEIQPAAKISTMTQSAELAMQWGVGILILNEALNPWTIIGVAIVVICGALLASLREESMHRTDRRPVDAATATRTSSSTCTGGTTSNRH